MESHINVGFGSDIAIVDLVNLVARVVDFNGAIKFDSQMPDGTPRKLLDSSKITKLGWAPTVNLEVGLQKAYMDFLEAK